MTVQHDISDDTPNTYGRSCVTCPHCGNEYQDSWEWRDDEGEEECGDCGKKFTWNRVITVEYESEALKPSN